MTDHIYRQFDQDLEAIRSQMMRMGGLVETQVRQAIGAFLEADAARAVALIAADAEVNELELAIDNEVAQIIVRRQPAASDLRLLLSASKIVTDLERIGDEATKVARLARERARGTAHGSAALRHVSDVALGMLRQALDAFARLDAAAAARVCGEDASIDEEFRAIMRQLITFMMEDARTITASLQVVWAAKAFERIGDHAKNIAEHVIYIVKGRDVRHIPLAELEKEALGR
ncbi:MAG: phosphate signaling complex protein PhoU [Betaproteobacteria bacterium]